MAGSPRNSSLHTANYAIAAAARICLLLSFFKLSQATLFSATSKHTAKAMPLEKNCSNNLELIRGTQIETLVGNVTITPYSKHDIVSESIISQGAWENHELQQILWALAQAPPGNVSDNSSTLFVDVGRRLICMEKFNLFIQLSLQNRSRGLRSYWQRTPACHSTAPQPHMYLRNQASPNFCR